MPLIPEEFRSYYPQLVDNDNSISQPGLVYNKTVKTVGKLEKITKPNKKLLSVNVSDSTKNSIQNWMKSRKSVRTNNIILF